MIELLSPAGNKESFLSAVNNGADAVYLGLNSFSARSNINNFGFDELEYVIKYAKLFNVKIYITVNTLIKDNELTLFYENIKKAYLLGADAFIVQDMFLGKILKKMFPEIVLHLSTQAGISNKVAVKLIKEYGFTRVVLARETPLEDIKEISKEIETEVFIQGALCTAYSGHCYFSSFVGGKSGNRGLCKQPCRKIYNYKVNGKSGINDCYALSLADLSVREKIKELIDIGVASFKIEGRMRRAEYVAEATKYYRQLIDNFSSNNNQKISISDLKRTFNRGDYTYGLGFSQDNNFISSFIQGHIGEKIGNVVGFIDKDIVKVSANKKYNGSVNDAYKIISNKKEVGNGIFLYRKNDFIYIKYKGNIKQNDEVNITTDYNLNKKILEYKKFIEINIACDFSINKYPEFFISYNGNDFNFKGDFLLEEARTSFLTSEELITVFNKTDDYPFKVNLSIKNLESVFVPKSKLNQLRRNIFDRIFSQNINYRKINEVIIDNLKESHNINKEQKIAIIGNKFSFIPPKNLKSIIFTPDDYNSLNEFIKFKKETENMNVKKYLFVPAFFNDKDTKIIESKLQYFDGIYADSYQGIALAEKNDKELFYGLGCNIFNNTDLCSLPFDGAGISLSKELSEKEISYFSKENYVFCLGNISLMDLIYCPFGKKCENCNINGDITLTDSDKRVFKVRKYKISTCRFEVYNAYDLIYRKIPDNNLLFNFVNFSLEKIKIILENIDNTTNLKNIIENYTYGNLAKGVE